MSIVRTFTCGACGAPRTTTDDAVFIACGFCGSLYDATTQRWFDARKQGGAFSRSHATAFWASKAAARFATLAQAMPAQDGPLYRARSEEYHYLYTLLHPDMVPAYVTASPLARVAWAKKATTTDALVRFAPEVCGLFAEMNQALRAFGNHKASTDEMVVAARLALERATRAYGALKSHPDAAHDYPAPAAHYARMTVRVSFSNMMSIYEDPAIFDRVVIEVFGDRHGVGEECARCGAPVGEPLAETERCGHCGAVLERFTDDPWVRARVALYQAALLDLHRNNQLDTYVPALGAFSCVGSFEKAGALRVSAFLGRAIPWVPTAELQKATSLYRDLLKDEAQRVFDEALRALEPWTPDPSRRRAPPAAPDAPFDETAWIDKSRALYRSARCGGAANRPDGVMVAFSIAVTDVLVALPNARPPITVALVLRFFDEVLAGTPRSIWREQLAPLCAGYADTPAGGLVQSIVDAL